MTLSCDELFKDCPRCFTYPTADCPGQHQTLQDSIFHGYTENIGNIHPDRGDFMKEKGEIKSVSSTTVQGGVEMYTYWYKAPDGIYRTQASFRITTRWYNSERLPWRSSRYDGFVARESMVQVLMDHRSERIFKIVRTPFM